MTVTAAEPVQINIPSIIINGAGAFDEAVPQAVRAGLENVLVVSDPYLVEQGLPARIAEQCRRAGIGAHVYGDVTPEPTDVNVEEGLAMLREYGCDGVIAVGGGSSIDAGKAIAVMAANDGPLSEYAGYHRIPRPGLPLFAIPTTAGTGSEMTRVTVITDTRRDVKMMMLDTHLLPTAAMVDYTLTLSMPRPLTANVGVDTLTHGIEAYVSRKAGTMTDALALSCVDLVGRHLVQAWRQPGDHGARKGMMEAASLGGMAFANSSVCLVHGMSRPLGAVFHLPHGLSNSVLLPAVTRFSVSAAPERYAVLARKLGWAEEAHDTSEACDLLVAGLQKLNDTVEIPGLRDCGISQEELAGALDKMAADALASGSPQNNPRVPTADEIKSLYLEAY